jgi:hypothetical protein
MSSVFVAWEIVVPLWSCDSGYTAALLVSLLALGVALRRGTA